MSGNASALVAKWIRHHRITIGKGVTLATDAGFSSVAAGTDPDGNPPYGAIDVAASFSGNLLQAWSSPFGSTGDIILTISTPGLAKTYFSFIYVEDSTGVFRTYQSSASFLNSPAVAGATVWRWGGGGSPVWTAADLGNLRRLEIY